MNLINLIIVLFYTVPCIIANNISILTDWKKTTLQCMNDFFETRYLTKYDTNIIIFGLDEKEESVVHNVNLQHFKALMSQYHHTDYQPQERDLKYYSKLIQALNFSNNELLLFIDKLPFSNLNYFQQNKNVKIIWCKNGECESCEKQKPIALAIVNQVPETKNFYFDEQNQSKNEASDKSWLDESIIGTKSFILELSPHSVLTGIPGETVKLYFRVINKHWLPLEYTFHCYDQMGLIRSVLPTSIQLPPNSAPFDVTVVLEVIGPEGSTDQITFAVQQPEFESIKINFYIGKLMRDTIRPTISYIFNGDCRFADSPHTCASEKWSIEATIQDDDSGIAMISSIPNNLRFRNEFSIGTREPVHVYYTSTCCFPKIEIIATDVWDNTAKKTIDAEKQYLNMAEIGLIVLSGILLLVFILLLVYLIIRCQRRKRSRDFLSG